MLVAIIKLINISKEKQVGYYLIRYIILNNIKLILTILVTIQLNISKQFLCVVYLLLI